MRPKRMRPKRMRPKRMRPKRMRPKRMRPKRMRPCNCFLFALFSQIKNSYNLELVFIQMCNLS
jgi:hypothetical protein